MRSDWQGGEGNARWRKLSYREMRRYCLNNVRYYRSRGAYMAIGSARMEMVRIRKLYRRGEIPLDWNFDWANNNYVPVVPDPPLI